MQAVEAIRGRVNKSFAPVTFLSAVAAGVSWGHQTLSWAISAGPVRCRLISGLGLWVFFVAFLSVSGCVSVCQSLVVSVSVSGCVSVWLRQCLSLAVSVSVSLWLCRCLSVSGCVCVCLWLCQCLSVSGCVSVCLSLVVSVSVYLWLSRPDITAMVDWA